MNRNTSTKPAGPDHSESPYLDSVHRLAATNKGIPRGWNMLYRRLTESLLAAQANSRRDLELGLPLICDGTLYVPQSRCDHTVRGILRRYSAKLACTCTQCGSRAKARQVGLSMQPLCARCYAYRALRWQLAYFLNTILTRQAGDPDILPESEVPPLVRIALPDQIWISAKHMTSNGIRRCTTVGAVEYEVPRLRLLLSHLENSTRENADVLVGGDTHG